MSNAQLELTLNTLAELFHAPESDPLHGVFDERSGVERILDELKAKPSARDVSVIVRVPATELTDDSEAQVRAALVGYCSAHMQQMTRAQAPIRRLGIRTIVLGVLFVGGGLSLSFLFSGMLNAPQFLSSLIVEGFLIGGWVALWYAIEIWLFEIWEKRGERQYYERLQNMPLQIQPLSTQTDKTE